MGTINQVWEIENIKTKKKYKIKKDERKKTIY